MNMKVSLSIFIVLILCVIFSAKGWPLSDIFSHAVEGDPYDDEHQDVPSHEKAYFDARPELSDSQVMDLLNDDDGSEDDGISSILAFYTGH